MGITKLEALKAVDRERGPVCEASDKIWDQPETAFQEFHSTDVLCELLEKEGFKVEKNLAGIATAFSGTYGSGKPVVGILGEFDALSGLSQESESLESSLAARARKAAPERASWRETAYLTSWTSL